MITLEAIQRRVGVPDDGKWGPATAVAVGRALGMVDDARAPGADMLTPRVALYLIGHEAIVQEWYRDSEGVGTWGVGVTNASGHNVDRYKDNPQPIEKCLAVYVWLLRRVYIPDVVAAFAGSPLTEAQFAAALSFHYNTGAIRKTDWVRLFREGKSAEARQFLETHYLNGGALKARRMGEAVLFFSGIWPGIDGTATVWPVRKPSYTPDWAHPRRVDVRADMERALAA